MLFKLKDLSRFGIRASDGNLGKVKTVYFDDHSWVVRYLVADTGNWLSENLVLLHPACLTVPNEDDQHIDVNITKEQVEAGPNIEQKRPVSKQHLADLHAYYDWPIFWAGGLARPGVSTHMMVKDHDENNEPKGDPHLRSANEVVGYQVQATDGELGSISDFIVDASNWTIRYVIVDTGNWLPGKKVLMSPRWVDAVNWADATVKVLMTQETVKNAPEYDPRVPLTNNYEKKLYDYYGRSLDWEKKQKETALI